MEPSPYRWIQKAQENHVWRYPIKATIVPYPGEKHEVIVWPDWIEQIEEVDPYEPDRPEFE